MGEFLTQWSADRTHYPSHGFGEMFPFPPELMTPMTPADSAADTHSSLSASDSSAVTDEPTGSSSHSTPVGAIVGAVIGSVAFICLVIAAAALIFRQRRRRQTTANASAPTGAANTDRSTNAPPAIEKAQAQTESAPIGIKNGRRSLLRPLSMIREQPSPIPATTPSPAREKHKSTATRQSFRPSWPLGSSNPLAAHPVDIDTVKRLSGNVGRVKSKALESEEQPQLQPQHVPILQVPAPPPPGTRPAPLPLPKTPRNSSSTNSTPTSATAMLRSPRVDYVPVSPIEAVAFSDDVERRVSRLFDPTLVRNEMDRNDPGVGARAEGDATIARRPLSIGPEPVSPMEEDDEEVEEDVQRLSCVSVPTAPGDGRRDVDEIVSPVSPEEPETGRGEDDRESPATISPLESRRESSET
ncbi:hypothetical protein AAE478_000707 [Parahypoxylon ruwenzoriense]